MCLGLNFGCAPPLLAGVSGCVCVYVRAPPVPRHSWLYLAVCVLQIALLSGYALPQVTRTAHSAVTRGLSTSSNDHTATTRYLYTVRHLLPMPHCCHLTLCAAWLRRHAHWAGDSYSSWHLDPSMSPDGTTGFWCGDWEILHLHAAKVKPNNHDCPPWETMCV